MATLSLLYGRLDRSIGCRYRLIRWIDRPLQLISTLSLDFNDVRSFRVRAILYMSGSFHRLDFLRSITMRSRRSTINLLDLRGFTCEAVAILFRDRLCVSSLSLSRRTFELVWPNNKKHTHTRSRSVDCGEAAATS